MGHDMSLLVHAGDLNGRPVVTLDTAEDVAEDTIHALVADGDDLADIGGSDVVIHPTLANLEDVFVTISRNRQRELGLAP
jgi:hypothetical protein